jgi:HAE1 family hydrophobic/amphiphilic exporter-1
MSKDKTIWSFFIDNYKFTILIVVSLIGFGILSAVQLPKESDPEVNIPIAVVSVGFPGAGVEEVEELITNKIEDKLSGVSDISVMRSTSRAGNSTVIIEFDPNKDADKLLDNIKEKVDQVKPSLPEDATDPYVAQASFEDQAFLIMSLSGPYDIAQLKLYAEELESKIERIDGVNDVKVIGGKSREIQVVVDKSKLDTFGLSISSITQAISAANNDIPIGSIETAGEEYNLRFAGRLKDAKEIEGVPIGTINGVPVLVGDVSSVVDTFSKPNSYSFLSKNGGNVNPAVTLNVLKVPGGDITKISDEVQMIAKKIVKEDFPENITVEPVQDVAEYIRDDLGNLTRNGIATVIIVVFLLVLFIGWREALMAGLSIPMAFLITFIGLLIFDLTINFITLFSLILALGILVDSTIVINQGLNRHRRQGKPVRQAAIDTIREFQYPLISGTLTTVFAFIPMLLTGGIIGEYIKTIPVTVSLVLAASLFIALAVVPTISFVLFKKNGESKECKENRFEKHFTSLRIWYIEKLKNLLEQKKLRKKLKIYLALALIGAYLLPITGILKVEMFPVSDIDFFTINVEKPFGTPLEETKDIVLDITDDLTDDNRIDNFVVGIGSTMSYGSEGNSSGSHLGYILINLKDDNKQKSYEVVDEYSRNYSGFLEAKVNVSQPSSGPPTSAPVEIKISGQDMKELERISHDFEKLLSSIEGTRNIGTSLVQTNGQFVIEVDRVRAQQYGVNATQLAMVLRNAINGTQATEISQDGQDVDVIVKYRLNDDIEKETTITDISTIEALTIATPTGNIPVSSLASIKLENSRASIVHEDGDRIIKVFSYLDANKTPLEVFAQVKTRMNKEIDIPSEYYVSLGGESEDVQESFSDMLRAMILSVILIAGLMVLQFKSFKQSLLIILTIPLALIGVFPGLLLMGESISFPGVIGIVALAGIVVNNAIILIDRMNNNKRSGMPLKESILDAGSSRLDPVVLTTITTVFGILPLAITQPMWAALGYAIIYGLLFSTITTLVVIPLVYSRIYNKKK